MALAATHRYLDDTVLACPSRATVRLYDSAIAALRAAVEAIELDDVEARCRAVRTATEVVTTLYLHIDVQRDGEVADGLSQIYSHVVGLLLRVNLYNDAWFAERAIDLLEPLRGSWANVETLVAQSLQDQSASLWLAGAK